MKTTEEITGLKNAWRHDPCWDIECTEGFEDHYDELLEYRCRCEQRWEDRRNKELMAKAEKIGVPGNTELARYIDSLESRIKELEESMIEIGQRI